VSEGLTVVLAAFVSALVSYFVQYAEKKRLERELQRRLTEKLYDLRLEAYRKAFELTLPLKGISESKRMMTITDLNFVLGNLERWYSIDAALIITKKTYDTFHALRRSLEKSIESEIDVQPNKLKKIGEARKRFRLSLREDLKLLYGEEEQPNDSKVKLGKLSLWPRIMRRSRT